MSFARRVHLMGLVAVVALLVGFAGSVTAWAQVAVPLGKVEITDVSFLQGFELNGAMFPTTPALVMFDAQADRRINLPEWTQGGNREPAAVEMGKAIEVYARFHGSDDPEFGPLERATISGESNNPDVPSLRTKLRVFFLNGVSVPDVTPQIPAVDPGFVMFKTSGRLPKNRIAVYSGGWTWTARNLRYARGRRPGPITIGMTQHTFFAIRRSPVKAQDVEDEQLEQVPFFKQVVRFSCAWAQEDGVLGASEILRAFLPKLGDAGRYVLRSRTGLLPTQEYSSGQANDLDFLLDNEQDECGAWTFLFVQAASAQSIENLQVESPKLWVPGAVTETVTLVTAPWDPPPPDLVPVRSLTIAGAERFASSFKTKSLTAIRAETQEWLFGAHCFAMRGRYAYDPTFQRFDFSNSWSDYILTSLTKGESDFWVESVLPDYWLSDAAFWHEESAALGSWKTRAPGPTNLYYFLNRGQTATGELR